MPGCRARDVDVVYASANATRALDAAEAAALTTLFGGSRTVITSIKGALGESGVAGATSCAAALAVRTRGAGAADCRSDAAQTRRLPR